MSKLRALPILITTLAAPFLLSSCDRINNTNRTLDTMLGGDFDVYIQGYPEVLHVENGKVTTVAEKGYYVFYPTINGKKRMVQSPIHTTTIVEAP